MITNIGVNKDARENRRAPVTPAVIYLMRTITTISIFAALVAGVLAYFNNRSTHEYFGYFQAEKVLIESLDRHRDKVIRNEDSTEAQELRRFLSYFKHGYSLQFIWIPPLVF